MNPAELRYSKEHEWVRKESDSIGVIGVTQFAVGELGDIVFLELPEVGSEVTRDGQMGEVESVKAVSEIYSPVTGRVIERNEEAVDDPEAVNNSPYDDGWLVKVEMTDPSELDSLMSAEQYEEFISS